ncbi:MAG: hypothetical protein HY337_11765 [Gemmatimonadetes bacterium]|nr:hypothetical protein [Gemmatimonadota bacterium]
MSRRRASGVRAGVVAAVGFLLLDAILLGLAGFWGRRPVLVIWAAVLAVGAAGVLVVWRRYLAHLVELDDQHRAMRAEVERLRSAVRNGSTN